MARPPFGTGEIGDGVMLAVVAGPIPEIGPVRTYDPVNPCDVGAISPPNEPPPALFRSSEADVVGMPLVDNAFLPMTFHQRLYQWPKTGVGPVRIGDGKVGVSKPPTEVPAGQTVWPISPISLIPIFGYGIETARPPFIGTALDVETVLPQRGNSIREAWTFYRTMPWTPTVFIRNVQLEGDTEQFILLGTTYDRLGTTPVPGCRVLILEAGALAIGTPTVVIGETVSDGSGNYSIQVPGRPVQVLVYLPGAPDLAGVSRNDVIRTATNIFMHDPLTADPPSGGGDGYSRGRVVNT